MIVDRVKDELSLIKRGENKVDSGHILLLEFDGTLGVIRGSVKASMKNEKHQVEVRANKFTLIILLHLYTQEKQCPTQGLGISG